MFTLAKGSTWDAVNIWVNIIMDSLTLAYVVYLIREGILELRTQVNHNFRFFRIYGLVFEIILFIGAALTLAFVEWNNVNIWSMMPAILFEIGLFLLLLVDLKKLQRAKSKKIAIDH